jgi:hypothetical protein
MVRPQPSYLPPRCRQGPACSDELVGANCAIRFGDELTRRPADPSIAPRQFNVCCVPPELMRRCPGWCCADAKELESCADDQLRGVIRDWLDRQYNTDERSKPKLVEVGGTCLTLPMLKVRPNPSPSTPCRQHMYLDPTQFPGGSQVTSLATSNTPAFHWRPITV